MKILVCVKQVPSSAAFATVDPVRRIIKIQDHANFKVSRFDAYALEQALRIKESVSGTTVHALSMGPKQVEDTIRRAMGMGADGGIHVLAPDTGYTSPVVTATCISEAIEGRGFDLVLAGIISEDYGNGLVGPMLSEILGMPCITSVVDMVFSEKNSAMIVEREVPGGRTDRYEISLPAVLTIQAGKYQPRYPSLSHVMRANQQDIDVVRIDHPGHDMRFKPEVFLGAEYPRKVRAAQILEGSRDEKAQKLVALLRGKHLM